MTRGPSEGPTWVGEAIHGWCPACRCRGLVLFPGGVLQKELDAAEAGMDPRAWVRFEVFCKTCRYIVAEVETWREELAQPRVRFWVMSPVPPRPVPSAAPTG